MINWDGVDRAITFVTYMAIAFNIFVVIAAMSLLAMMQDHESKGGGKYDIAKGEWSTWSYDNL